MTTPTNPRKATATTSPTTPSETKAMIQTTTQEARLYSIHTSMVAATNIMKLAQFAVEARRTLEGIDDLKRIRPEVDTAIHQHVEACNEWGMCEDVLGQVLGHAVNQLERDQDELERVIGAMGRATRASSASNGETPKW